MKKEIIIGTPTELQDWVPVLRMILKEACIADGIPYQNNMITIQDVAGWLNQFKENHEQPMAVLDKHTMELVGALVITRSDNSLVILELVIREDLRRTGYGRPVVREVIEKTISIGWSLYLTSRKQSEGFWKKMGFIYTGRNKKEGPQMVYHQLALPQKIEYHDQQNAIIPDTGRKSKQVI